jgi:hypothetical protein
VSASVRTAATGPPGGSNDRWRLVDEVEFLERSLADAEAEHAAGDLADRDFEALVRRDTARLTQVRDALSAMDEAPVPSAPKQRRTTARRARRRRPWLAVAGGALVLAALVLVGINLAASPRLPGESETGSIKVSRSQQAAQQLSEAGTLAHEGNDSAALTLYRLVLREEPTEPEALAAAGWLEWRSSQSAKEDAKLASDGQTLVTEALAHDPSFGTAHLYLGTIDLLGHHDAADAVAQYNAFLASHPPAATVAAAKSDLVSAYQQAGEPVPSGVSGG